MLTPHKIFKLTAGTRGLCDSLSRAGKGRRVRQDRVQAEGELALKGVHRARQQGGRGKQAGRQPGRGTLKRLDVLPACLPAMLHAPFWLASYLSTLVKPAWHLPGRCVQGVCVRVSVSHCMCVCVFLPSGFMLVFFLLFLLNFLFGCCA